MSKRVIWWHDSNVSQSRVEIICVKIVLKAGSTCMYVQYYTFQVLVYPNILMYHANGRIHFTVETDIKFLCNCLFAASKILIFFMCCWWISERKYTWHMLRLENPYDWFSLLKNTQINLFILLAVFQKERMIQNTKYLKPVPGASLDNNTYTQSDNLATYL